jgi:hypothetical protein
VPSVGPVEGNKVTVLGGSPVQDLAWTCLETKKGKEAKKKSQSYHSLLIELLGKRPKKFMGKKKKKTELPYE